jgi:hypothetical protein
MEDISHYVLMTHCTRAIGYLSADLVERGYLPSDFESPLLLDMWGEALNKTLDLSEQSPITISTELIRVILNSS